MEGFRAVDRAFSELASSWDEYLSAFKVESPVPSFDSMVNVHNPRQCFVTKNWSRYLSLYQLGFGSDRGIGFRDSAQDIMGVMAHMPAQAAELALKLLSVQRRDGSAMHQFNPLTMIASEGDSRERDDRPHYYSDDHLWIILAVCAYVKETGDLAFLRKEVPFYDKDERGRTTTTEKATVLEHLQRAAAFTHGDLGRHGLPLLGYADWNDTVNLPKGAESVFTACLYGAALLELAALADAQGKGGSAATWRAWHAEMKRSMNEAAWDGEWWLRYFDADGSPIGTRSAQRARIWINSQTWSVIARFAEGERARECLDSVFRLLNTDRGLKLSWPGYDGYDPAVGGVTTYPPGAKENGGIFLHANPWAVIAECERGDCDRAWRYYQQINPAARNDDIDSFEVEPYVYPQNILGDEHPQFGLGRNSWLSGTSSWAYQAATQRILGIRPDYDALVVDPRFARHLERLYGHEALPRRDLPHPRQEPSRRRQGREFGDLGRQAARASRKHRQRLCRPAPDAAGHGPRRGNRHRLNGRYGGSKHEIRPFRRSHREYVVTRPDTPLPWLNYLGPGRLLRPMHQHRRRLTFWKDARLRRLTRYRYNNIPYDIGGRYIYVNDGGRYGTPAGSRSRPSWTPTSAATAWATPGSPGRRTDSRSSCSSSSRQARTRKSGR